jgi:hypothetical protein
VNPYACRIALRPRGPLEVFDLSLRLMRERAAPMARLAVVVLGPAVLACWALGWLAGGSMWALVVPALLGPLLQVPFTVLAGRLLFADIVPARDVVAGLRAALLPYAAYWLLIEVLAAAFCGVGLLVAGVLLYLPEALLLERVGLGRGIGRAAGLVGGQPVGALGGVVARLGLPLWGLVVGELTGQLIVGWVLQLGQPFGALADGHATPYAILGILLGQPVIAVYRLLLYVDARTRQEGWDLQVAMRALGVSRVP